MFTHVTAKKYDKTDQKNTIGQTSYYNVSFFSLLYYVLLIIIKDLLCKIMKNKL